MLFPARPETTFWIRQRIDTFHSRLNDDLTPGETARHYTNTSMSCTEVPLNPDHLSQTQPSPEEQLRAQRPHRTNELPRLSAPAQHRKPPQHEPRHHWDATTRARTSHWCSVAARSVSSRLVPSRAGPGRRQRHSTMASTLYRRDSGQSVTKTGRC